MAIFLMNNGGSIGVNMRMLIYCVIFIVLPIQNLFGLEYDKVYTKQIKKYIYDACNAKYGSKGLFDEELDKSQRQINELLKSALNDPHKNRNKNIDKALRHWYVVEMNLHQDSFDCYIDMARTSALYVILALYSAENKSYYDYTVFLDHAEEVLTVHGSKEVDGNPEESFEVRYYAILVLETILAAKRDSEEYLDTTNLKEYLNKYKKKLTRENYIEAKKVLKHLNKFTKP